MKSAMGFHLPLAFLSVGSIISRPGEAKKTTCQSISQSFPPPPPPLFFPTPSLLPTSFADLVVNMVVDRASTLTTYSHRSTWTRSVLNPTLLYRLRLAARLTNTFLENNIIHCKDLNVTLSQR